MNAYHIMIFVLSLTGGLALVFGSTCAEEVGFAGPLRISPRR